MPNASNKWGVGLGGRKFKRWPNPLLPSNLRWKIPTSFVVKWKLVGNRKWPRWKLGNCLALSFPKWFVLPWSCQKTSTFFLWTSKYQKLKGGIDLLGVKYNNSLLYMCHFWSNKSLCMTWSKKFVSVGSIMTTIKVQTPTLERMMLTCW